MNNDISPKLGSHCFPHDIEQLNNPTKNGTTEAFEDIIYGIKVPSGHPTTERLLNFIRNHQDALPPFEDEEKKYIKDNVMYNEEENEDFDTMRELQFYMWYYYPEGEYNPFPKMIADAAGDFYYATENTHANLDGEYEDYVGILAYVSFPWTNLAGEDEDEYNAIPVKSRLCKPEYYDAWKAIKSKDVENTLVPLVKELYGDNTDDFCYAYIM